MAIHNFWFVPRNIRILNTIPDYLSVFNDLVVGKNWSHERTGLQVIAEDELKNRQLRNIHDLRAREENKGCGGIRTSFGLLKALGFLMETGTDEIVRLTWAGEELLAGNQSFVDIMRDRLLKFQYPSNYFSKGSAKVSSDFQIHPFWFLLKLMRDERINYLTTQEIQKIVIIFGRNETNTCYENVVSKILTYRNFLETTELVINGSHFTDEEKEILGYDPGDYNLAIKYSSRGSVNSNPGYDVANTLINWLDSTLFISRSKEKITLNPVFRTEIDDFIKNKPALILGPIIDIHENFQKKFGCDKTHSKDLRRFDSESTNQKNIRENKICGALVRKAMNSIIDEITPDLVNEIAMETGISQELVEHSIRTRFPHGISDDGFLIRYKEMSAASTDEAILFEKATKEIFEKRFKFKAEHTGQKRDSDGIGGYPDVYIESDDYAGIIDNKAYAAYSISADHILRMENYVKKYRDNQPQVKFFIYISNGFGKNISNQVDNLHERLNIDGSAITADQIIEMVKFNEKRPYTHKELISIFSVNRRIQLKDYYIH